MNVCTYVNTHGIRCHLGLVSGIQNDMSVRMVVAKLKKDDTSRISDPESSWIGVESLRFEYVELAPWPQIAGLSLQETPRVQGVLTMTHVEISKKWGYPKRTHNNGISHKYNTL